MPVHLKKLAARLLLLSSLMAALQAQDHLTDGDFSNDYEEERPLLSPGDSHLSRSQAAYAPSLFEGLLACGSFSPRLVLDLSQAPDGYLQSLEQAYQHIPLSGAASAAPLLQRITLKGHSRQLPPDESLALSPFPARFNEGLPLRAALPDNRVDAPIFALPQVHFHRSLQRLQEERLVDLLASKEFITDNRASKLRHSLVEGLATDEEAALAGVDPDGNSSHLFHFIFWLGSSLVLLVGGAAYLRYRRRDKRSSRRRSWNHGHVPSPSSAHPFPPGFDGAGTPAPQTAAAPPQPQPSSPASAPQAPQVAPQPQAPLPTPQQAWIPGPFAQPSRGNALPAAPTSDAAAQPAPTSTPTPKWEALPPPSLPSPQAPAPGREGIPVIPAPRPSARRKSHRARKKEQLQKPGQPSRSLGSHLRSVGRKLMRLLGLRIRHRRRRSRHRHHRHSSHHG